eukprot:4249533-Pleurochrysis_carterae.AAC.1
MEEGLTTIYTCSTDGSLTDDILKLVHTRRPVTCASHASTCFVSVPFGNRSAFVPTTKIGLAPTMSLTRGSIDPATSTRSTSSTTNAFRVRSGSSCARSSSGVVTPPSSSVRKRPSTTAGRICPCARERQRTQSS